MKTVEVFGDSILKGVQYDSTLGRCRVDNHIDVARIETAFGLAVTNRSRFGCTVTKGYDLLCRRLDAGEPIDFVVTDYGGNDCDFDWDAVAASPDAEHLPHTPADVFVRTYTDMIRLMRHHGIRPVMTTLPPIMPSRFLRHYCRAENLEAVLHWLGGEDTVYRYQESYSRMTEKIARAENVPIVDLRGAFLKHRRIDGLLGEDGIHPSEAGQKVITEAFLDFASSYAGAV